jgi:hypothetical protein
MSSPEELTRLKTSTDLYEQDVLENNEIYHKASNIQNAAHLLNSFFLDYSTHSPQSVFGEFRLLKNLLQPVLFRGILSTSPNVLDLQTD